MVFAVFETPEIVQCAVKSHQKVICSHHCSRNRFAKNDCQRGALSILMKMALQIWWPDSNNNMEGGGGGWSVGGGAVSDVAMCLWSVRAWFDKRSEFDIEREGGGGSWLKWRVPGWREPARDKASAKPRPLEQLFLHAAFGLVQWKEAYVWPGATLPPWLTAEDAGRGARRRAEGGRERERKKEGGWLKLEYKNAWTEWGNINANLIRSFLDIYEDTQEREIDRLQSLIGEWGTTMCRNRISPNLTITYITCINYELPDPNVYSWSLNVF